VGGGQVNTDPTGTIFTTGTSTTWGPVFFRDSTGGIHVFVSLKNGSGNIHTYEMHPTLLSSSTSTWSNPVLLNLPSNNENDFFCWLDGTTYHATYQDFSRAGAPRAHVTAASLTGTWSSYSGGDLPSIANGEGSFVLPRVGGGWRWYDGPDNGHSTSYKFQDLDSNYLPQGAILFVNSTVSIQNGHACSAQNVTSSPGDVAINPSTGYQQPENVNFTGGQITGLSNLQSNYLFITGTFDLPNGIGTLRGLTFSINSGATFSQNATSGHYELPHDTRRGAMAYYNDSNSFGIEQVSSSQTGSAPATRISTADGGGYISLGKYTGSTAFTDWLKLDSGGNATFAGSGIFTGSISTAGLTSSAQVQVPADNGWSSGGIRFLNGSGAASGFLGQFTNDNGQLAMRLPNVGSPSFAIYTSGGGGPVATIDNSGNLSCNGTSTLGTNGVSFTRLRHGSVAITSGTATIIDPNITTATEIYVSNATGTAAYFNPIQYSGSAVITSSPAVSGTIRYLEIQP
jgi:hypothetical protein